MATRIEKTDLARDALYNKVNTMIDEVNTKIDNKDSLPSQTGKAGKFLTTDGTNASWGEVKQIEIKQDLTNPSADTVPSTKAVKTAIDTKDSLPSQTGQSGKFLTTNGTTTSWAAVNVDTSDIYNKIDTKQDKSTAVNYNNISNCITYISQDIKLELNNMKLTLKAGSKVYVPNGFEADGTTPKFDEVVIENDKVCDKYNIGACVVIIDDSVGSLYANFDINLSTYSGSSAPTDFVGLFYNTTTNTIGARFDTSSQFTGRYSLPIAIVTNPSPIFCFSIDQVFNGFGYIGSTVFALPGVKGLIPNGRNADGSLKNIEVKFTNVKTQTFPSNLSLNVVFGAGTSDITANGKYKYDEQNNYNYDGSTIWPRCYYAIGHLTNGRITSFTPKTAFHALDNNDKSTISGWSMPSSRYIDLTLGASSSSYKAPANGWFVLYIISGLTLLDIWNRIDYGIISANPNNGFIRQFVPAFKGDEFTIVYNGTPKVDTFRFIYAEGEK